jgi:calmodulin
VTVCFCFADEASVKQLSDWSSSIVEDLKSSDAPQVLESVNSSDKDNVCVETGENLMEQVAA